MTAAKASTTWFSTKGQVNLPKPIRDEKKRGPGARLIVESTPRGVLLCQEERAFARTEFDDVRGSLSGLGESLSPEEIDAALRVAAERRYARG
jgi:bifunctional DNA-binding transcriptional regulator/antitoxin component of YhaV-PrlF toxin-antitoxin module